MGTYDSIKNELYCPFCGKIQKEHSFQTKSFGRSFNNIDIFKVRGIDYNIYTTCWFCNNWINLEISRHNPIVTIQKGREQINQRKKR